MAREPNIAAWQWAGYARNHRDPTSLVLHMVGVPMFVAGVLAGLRLALAGFLAGSVFALTVAVAGFALQGLGHRREQVPPEPFDGPADFLARVFVEQFYTFPRFVLSGGWLRNLTGRS
ncbi:MAG TPA: Mpo1-like protein [Xanthomonadales bacterium]|nr:Mpo1-like protein [Xanthomonadales bacterium]